MEMFRVPQQEIEVRVQLQGGLQLDGIFYAAESSPGGGPGRLRDRLNDPAEKFLPLATHPLTYLVNKDWLLSVRLPLDRTETELEYDDGRHVRVAVKLSDGAHFEGEMRFSMPPGRNRVLDFLNDSPTFVGVLLEDSVVLLNRHHVTSVVTMDADADE